MNNVRYVVPRCFNRLRRRLEPSRHPPVAWSGSFEASNGQSKLEIRRSRLRMPHFKPRMTWSRLGMAHSKPRMAKVRLEMPHSKLGMTYSRLRMPYPSLGALVQGFECFFRGRRGSVIEVGMGHLKQAPTAKK